MINLKEDLINSMKETEYLLLKWGTLKDWQIYSKESYIILAKYLETPVSMSCALQKDTPEQKKIICKLIDCLDGKIQDDWSGEFLTKEEAKEYILNYNNKDVKNESKRIDADAY